MAETEISFSFGHCLLKNSENSMLSSKKRAFTLIELLVVIAIIAILAAILFPVFAQAREKARQITCESNAKQFMLGILQYAQDADEAMPMAYAVPNSIGPYASQILGTPTTGVPAEIMPYIKSTAVFHCPDDNGGMQTNGDTTCLSTTQEAGHTYADVVGTSYKFTHQGFSNPYTTTTTTGYSQPTDYAGNPAITLNVPPSSAVTSYNNPPAVAGLGVLTIGEFARPSETRMYADFPKNFEDKPIKSPGIPFHPQGVSIAYADGHVKYVIRYSQYASGCDGVDWAWDVPGSCNTANLQRAAD
jgi:prepilin-type N-terminal cleavage/methylation domain-containing protein/prepilin-type processing-associated H-X9-DG protein